MRDNFEELDYGDQKRFWWLADMGLLETINLIYGKFYVYKTRK